MLNKDIEAMTAWLESCDIKIGELQSKIDTVGNEDEKNQHQKELSKLKSERKRKQLKKQNSIDEKQMIEQKLKGMMKVEIKVCVEDLIGEEKIPNGDVVHVLDSHTSQATTSDGGESEESQYQAFKRTHTTVAIQKHMRAAHDLNCTCATCVDRMSKEIREAVLSTKEAVLVTRNTII